MAKLFQFHLFLNVPGLAPQTNDIPVAVGLVVIVLLLHLAEDELPADVDLRRNAVAHCQNHHQASVL
jgi:hypothetical protein